jgi:hypothetical protein
VPVQRPLRLHPAAVFIDGGGALDQSGFRWARSTAAVDLAAEMSDGGVGGLHRRRPADKECLRWIWWRLDRNGGSDGLLAGLHAYELTLAR